MYCRPLFILKPPHTRHFERSKPTSFPLTFAPANMSACDERNLSSLLAHTERTSPRPPPIPAPWPPSCAKENNRNIVRAPALEQCSLVSQRNNRTRLPSTLRRPFLRTVDYVRDFHDISDEPVNYQERKRRQRKLASAFHSARSALYGKDFSEPALS
jgi:hypothetical protein